MIDAGITRKITSDCSHSLPVVISCIECVQNALSKWEGRIRDDHSHVIADEVKQLKEALAKSRADYTKLQEINDRLVTAATKAEKAATAATGELRDTKRLVVDLRSQLHAEQAVRNQPRIVAVNE